MAVQNQEGLSLVTACLIKVIIFEFYIWITLRYLVLEDSMPGEDEKSIGGGQQAQQKPDASTYDFPSRDEETLKQVGETDTSPVNGHESGDVNMEAAISTEDVMRAGGFGAKDDIGSLLPVAIDSTDFEASLRDARGFEEIKEEPSHPGLGWIAKETGNETNPSDATNQ